VGPAHQINSSEAPTRAGRGVRHCVSWLGVDDLACGREPGIRTTFHSPRWSTPAGRAGPAVWTGWVAPVAAWCRGRPA